MTSVANARPRAARQPRRLKVNWPLLLGVLLVAAIAYLSAAGPDLAPRDPLEENLIVQDPATGEWHVPPFAAFTVTGFPLGSDEFGRDLLSRLLFAVRPTLQMVLVVAGVRLALGTLIGLAAGYLTGRAGGFFDTLISSALALPGLLVALGAIAIVGVELGVIAFIIGLSITGWAETARLVREQTRAIRSEVYVEAAQALGASDAQIVFRHVVRQIRAMLLMLLAFEVGGTLMLTAGLGFLGYYIGGDVWVDVADFVARRTSGSPELGQMLATAWVRLTDPWGLVAVGSVVFAAVLGFNLLGEGLRLRLDPEIQGLRIRWLSDGWGRFKLNLEQAWHPVGRLLFGSRIAMTLWLFAAGTVLGYAALTGLQQGLFKLPEPQRNMFFEEATPTPSPAPDSSAAASPGPSGPATAEPAVIAALPTPGTAPGSGWAFTTPADLLLPPLVTPDGDVYLITVEDEVYVIAPDGSTAHLFALPESVYLLTDEFFGGEARYPFPPMLASNGLLVVASATRLYAVGLDGQIAWEFPLDFEPYSPPVSSPDGAANYLIDQQGTLYAFSPESGLLWKHDLEEGLRPAYPFPVISQTGEVYYSITNGTRGQIEALDAQGAPRWRTVLTTFNFYRPIRITPDGEWISLNDNVVRTGTGELVELTGTEFDVSQVVLGLDSRTYLLSGSTVMQWALGAGGQLNLLRSVTIPRPANAALGQNPFITVTTNDTIWFEYPGTGGSHIVYQWAGFDGVVYNQFTVNLRNSFILAEDYTEIGIVVCELVAEEATLFCRGFGRDSAAPSWEIPITGISRVVDLQYEGGVLYLQTAPDTVQTVKVELPITGP